MASQCEIWIPPPGYRQCIADDSLGSLRRANDNSAERTPAFYPDDRATRDDAGIDARSDRVRHLFPRVNDCGESHTVALKVARGSPAIIVVGEDRHRLASGHGKAIGISSDPAGHHDAWPVIATENDAAFRRP